MGIDGSDMDILAQVTAISEGGHQVRRLPTADEQGAAFGPSLAGEDMMQQLVIVWNKRDKRILALDTAGTILWVADGRMSRRRYRSARKYRTMGKHRDGTETVKVVKLGVAP